MRSSVPSAVHLSIRTTVCPRCIAADPKVNTAVWYSGDTTRCTFPSAGMIPNIAWNDANISATVSGSMGGTARFTPLGCPVVPAV